jgi:hypothetical protein
MSTRPTRKRRLGLEPDFKALKFGCGARNASVAVVNYCKRAVTTPRAEILSPHQSTDTSITIKPLGHLAHVLDDSGMEDHVRIPKVVEGDLSRIEDDR